MKIKIFIVAVVFLFIYSCSSSNCDDEMDSIRAQYGEPEEINTYSSEGYYSEDWWYWSQGINFDFTWGSSVEGDCDMSTYTFDPIPADATDEEKAGVKTTLLDRKISLKGIY